MKSVVEIINFFHKTCATQKEING